MFRPTVEYLLPEIQEKYTVGAPPSAPSLAEMLKAWQEITTAVDPWLDAQTTRSLQSHVMSRGKPTQYIYGNLLQRVIYHYWYHTGEIVALRKMLGHMGIGQFVGNIDDKAPYKPE
jgi:hypothetical protein